MEIVDSSHQFTIQNSIRQKNKRYAVFCYEIDKTNSLNEETFLYGFCFWNIIVSKVSYVLSHKHSYTYSAQFIKPVHVLNYGKMSCKNYGWWAVLAYVECKNQPWIKKNEKKTKDQIKKS